VAILTDAAKRQRYDAGWSAEEIENGFQEGSGMGGMRGGEHMEDLLAAMFGGRAGFPSGGGGFPGGGFPGGGFPSGRGGYGGRSPHSGFGSGPSFASR